MDYYIEQLNRNVLNRRTGLAGTANQACKSFRWRNTSSGHIHNKLLSRNHDRSQAPLLGRIYRGRAVEKYDIAVLIPVLNDREGLFRSLSSISSDSPVAVIVIDDGSQPRVCLDEVNSSLNPHHRAFLFRHESNRGIVAALNRGLAACRNLNVMFVARLDAGDTCVDDRLDAQASFLETHPDVVLVGGQGEVVDQSGKRRFFVRLPTEDRPIRKMMHQNSAFIHPAVMIRTRTLWKLSEYYTEEFPWAEDYELFFRLLSHGKAANLSNTVVKKYDKDSSISVRNRRSQLLSRFRLQCRYFNPTVLRSWTGIFKTLCLLITPTPLVDRYRMSFWR